jgi:nicotinate-nucleotide adenylyltransferase
MKTIAIFGGSFDPLHDGHRAIIKALDGFLDIDKTIVLPTFLNPFKLSSHALAEQRFDILHLEYKDMKNVIISDYEVKQKTKVFSIQSVQYFLQEYKKIYLVIGADNLATLHKWQDFEKLEKLITFIVVTRNNIKIPEKYITLQVEHNISSTQKRNLNLQNRIQKITAVLDKNKAESVEVFDLREKNYFVDYAVIASSLSSRHTQALLNHMKNDLKPEETFNNVDISDDWIVVDLGDILIHIMTPEYRVKYDMETFLSNLSDGAEGDVL